METRVLSDRGTLTTEWTRPVTEHWSFLDLCETFHAAVLAEYSYETLTLIFLNEA